MTDPLTPEDERMLRRLAKADSERGWFTPSEVRRLLATLDAARADTAAALVEKIEAIQPACHSHSGLRCEPDAYGWCHLIDRAEVIAAIKGAAPNPVEKPTGSDTAALVRAALTDEDEIAHGEAVFAGNLADPRAYEGVGRCAYCDEPWPCRTQRGIDRLLSRLGTTCEDPNSRADTAALVKAAQPILDRCLDFFGPDDLDPESSEALPVVIKARWVYALRSALEATDAR